MGPGSGGVTPGMMSGSSSHHHSASSGSGASGQQDPAAQMNTFRSFVSMLADPGSKDENKLKAAQAISEDLEVSLINL